MSYTKFFDGNDGQVVLDTINNNADLLTKKLPNNLVVGTGTQTPTILTLGGGVGLTESAQLNNSGLYQTELPYLRRITGIVASGSCFTNRSINIESKPTSISFGFWLIDSQVNTVFSTGNFQVWFRYDNVNFATPSLDPKEKLGFEVAGTFTDATRVSGDFSFKIVAKSGNGHTYYTFNLTNLVWATTLPATTFLYYEYFNPVVAQFNGNNLDFISRTLVFNSPIVFPAIYPDSAGLKQVPETFATLKELVDANKAQTDTYNGRITNVETISEENQADLAFINADGLPLNAIIGTGTQTPTPWPAAGGNGLTTSAVVNESGIYEAQLPYIKRHTGTALSGNCFTNAPIDVTDRPSSIGVGYWMVDSQVDTVFATGQSKFWFYGEVTGFVVQSINLIDLRENGTIASGSFADGKLSGDWEVKAIAKSGNGHTYYTYNFTNLVWQAGYVANSIVFYWLYDNVGVREDFFGNNVDYIASTLLIGNTVTKAAIYPDSAGLLQYPPSIKGLQDQVTQNKTASESADALLQAEIDAIKNASGEIEVYFDGTNYYLRTPFDSTRDLVQRTSYSPRNGFSNEALRLTSTYLLDNTLNTNQTVSSGVLIDSNGDDIAPASYNGTYIGANHGYSNARNCTTSAPHGKTTADIGSEYIDGSGNKFYIIRIVSTTVLTLLGENTGTAEVWTSIAAPVATYTHSLNGTNTASFTVTVSEMWQILPAIKNVSFQYLLNDAPVNLLSGETDYCNTFKGVETYNIINPYDALNTLIANVGATYTDAELSAVFADAAPQVELSIVYEWQSNGALVINHSFRTIQQINIGYFGFTQATALVNVAGLPNTKMYVPKLGPITVGARTWNFATLEDFNAANAPTASINLVKAHWLDANNAPSRSVQFLADVSNNLDVGFATGYCTDRGLGAIRSANLASAGFIFTSRKNYPYGIDSSENPTTANKWYNAICFRQYFAAQDPDFGDATSVTTHKVGNDHFVYIDFHTTTPLSLIKIDDELKEKNITVVEKSANLTLHSDVVGADGIPVTVTAGDNAYLVIKCN